MEDGVTTIYVGAHYQLSGGVVTKYYFAGTQRIAQRVNGALSFILSDHLGSTGVVTDAAGTVIAEVRYTPYGETRFSAGTSPTDYLYTSQRQEAGLGLYFYNARWYDRLWDVSLRRIRSYRAQETRRRSIDLRTCLGIH